MALGAGSIVNLLKLAVWRVRPHHANLAGSVLATFVGWWPGLGAGTDGQSFPSGHTATAVVTECRQRSASRVPLRL